MNVEQITTIPCFTTFCRMAELFPWPILVLDDQRLIRFANSAFRELFECAAPELSPWVLDQGNPQLQNYLELQFAKFPAAGEQSAVTGNGQRPHQPSLRCRFPVRGRTLQVEIESCLLDDAGEPRLSLFFKNLTEQRVRRARNIERNRQLQSLLDNTGAVIYTKDRDGRYQYVNQLFEQLFHVKNRTLRGKTDHDIFEASIAEKFCQIDQEIMAAGQMQRVQELVSHDDGLHTYISVKFPLRDLRGRVTGLAGISTDITEQLWAEQEINAALAVQTLLYPRTAPVVEGFDLSGLVSPAQVASGDYFDYIWLTPQRLVLAVGDVSGHGLGPALEMVETRSYLRAILRTEVRLDVAMECLNEFLYRDLRDSAFVSLFLADMDLKERTFRYVGAGHRADFLTAAGEVVSLPSTGLLLGIDTQVKYECAGPISFAPGDLLLLWTDGIPEALSATREMFGSDRMLDYVRTHADRSAWDIASGLIHAARDYSIGSQQSDDMTAVVMKCLP